MKRISAPLSELFSHIVGGVNYVSKLAQETGKSIPVAYRQLEELITLGLLKKKRAGKKVVYEINYKQLGELINEYLAEEVYNVKEATKHPGKTLQKDINAFLENKHIQQHLGNFFSSEHKKSFREKMDEFLDAFGMLSATERKQVEENINADARTRSFLTFLEQRNKRKQKADPRKMLIREILDS